MLARAVFALLCVLPLSAQQGEPTPDTPAAPQQPADDLPQGVAGKVAIGNLASLDQPAQWRWLAGRKGQQWLEALGNYPDPGVLGVSVHPDYDMFVVFSYADDGHVDDQDAAGTDYAALLQQMQESVREQNPELKKAGYPTVQLLGWAEPPHYDSAGKKLYWAKRLQFSDTQSETVNYDVRVLGRSGHLVLQAVGGMDNLDNVRKGCQELLAATSFVPGKQYGDFDPGIDKIAAYGIGGLIAGKLLLKAGLFKVLLKPLLIGGAILIGVLAKVFGRKKRAAAAEAG